MPSPPKDPPPKCACRERCQFPELPQATGHHCPGCKFAIHAVCGVHNEEAGLDDSNWCYTCWDSRTQQKKGAASTRKTTTKPKTSGKKTTKHLLAAKMKPPPKSSTLHHQQQKAATSTTNLPRRTKNMKNKIVIPKEATIIDPFVRTRVAFHLDGPERPNWLVSNDYVPYGKNVGSRVYLFGIILRRDKATKIACTYRVEWEHTALGESIIDINVLQPAMELARKLQQVVEEESKHPLGEDVLHFLRANDGSTPGAAIPSDDEGTDRESEEDDEQDEDQECDKDDYSSINFTFPSLRKNGGQPNAQQDGLWWATNTSCSPSLGLYDETKRSTIKKDMHSRFTTPLSSFLSFLPLEFWKLVVFETNKYAANTLVGSPTVNWVTRLTLNELFTFLGILIKMTMRPTPGQTYTNCWQEKMWHPYTDRMTLRRFQAIRSMLHLSENGFAEESSNDALYKVRPLLNVLKKTLGDYMIPGSDLALDETSVACRSKYGRNLIFYNNSKPSGKYHFRFYALCDSDSYSCLRIVIHTRNGSDKADGYSGGMPEAVNENNDNDENISELGKTTKLVMDIARPFFHSGRVLNMDRYYTSPEVFIELRKQGLYARGTCMTNRRMFPKLVTYTEAEATKEGRGACRVAVNEENDLVAIGWVDGNPVHVLTTVDGTEMTHVTRRVHQAQQRQSAPTAVRKYGHGMQAVDRFDQLMSLYSLAKRHAFKKWYKKLSMALLDVGITNAEIHYFLLHKNEKTGMYRYNFREKLCSQLFDTDWSLYENMSNTDALEAIRVSHQREEESQEATSTSGNDTVVSCTPSMVNQYITTTSQNEDTQMKTYKGLCCQVCLFEGRRTRTKSVAFCEHHKIRACLTTPNLLSFKNEDFKTAVEGSTKDELELWRCPNSSDSCWRKAHSFYIPRGLWGQDATPTTTNARKITTKGVKVSSVLYQNREDWMLRHKLISKKGGTRGRKSKKRPAIGNDTFQPQKKTDMRDLDDPNDNNLATTPPALVTL